MRPLGDRVVIRADREDRAPETLASGLVAAKTLEAAVTGTDAQDSWFVGTIVALGPDVPRYYEFDPEFSSNPQPPTLRLGARVVFSWAAGQELTIDGEKWLILHASDVLGVLED